MGEIEKILIAKQAGNPLFAVDQADLEEGLGIVGDRTTLRAVRLCEPCKYLSGLLGEVVMENMMGKCGDDSATRPGLQRKKSKIRVQEK